MMFLFTAGEQAAALTTTLRTRFKCSHCTHDWEIDSQEAYFNLPSTLAHSTFQQHVCKATTCVDTIFRKDVCCPGCRRRHCVNQTAVAPLAIGELLILKLSTAPRQRLPPTITVGRSQFELVAYARRTPDPRHWTTVNPKQGNLVDDDKPFRPASRADEHAARLLMYQRVGGLPDVDPGELDRRKLRSEARSLGFIRSQAAVAEATSCSVGELLTPTRLTRNGRHKPGVDVIQPSAHNPHLQPSFVCPLHSSGLRECVGAAGFHRTVCPACSNRPITEEQYLRYICSNDDADGKRARHLLAREAKHAANRARKLAARRREKRIKVTVKKAKHDYHQVSTQTFLRQ
jgi:hypothetical protein